MHEKLPVYRNDAVAEKNDDHDLIMECPTIEALCKGIYGVELSQVVSETAIRQYLVSPFFERGAEYFKSDEMLGRLTRVILRVFDKAVKLGFPQKPLQGGQASRIDVALSGALMEALEEADFIVYPYQANARTMQAFMTQRILPLIVYWRWKIVTGNPLSKERVAASTRNYFYTLWISGWLFDRGKEYGSGRWDLLASMSADSLVQVIERSGIGYRKGFAQAVALERKNRTASPIGQDDLVRGCMKRATFTFSTAVMPDDEQYYREICTYLFDWAEKNYRPQVKEDVVV